ncbi:MAG TPA: hypothetical protein VFA95_12725 [Gammaproteobacteria bacterium]|nr:hypothetical protein [Gammaproteobacteria bacterium]
MDAEERRRTVNEELKHIPVGAEGGPQQELRMVYNEMRLSGLEKDQSLPRSVTFARSLAIVRDGAPDFEPDLLDPDYFD